MPCLVTLPLSKRVNTFELRFRAKVAAAVSFTLKPTAPLSGLAQPPEIFPHSAFGHFGPAPFPRAVLFPLGGEASACLPLHEQPVRI